MPFNRASVYVNLYSFLLLTWEKVLSTIESLFTPRTHNRIKMMFLYDGYIYAIVSPWFTLKSVSRKKKAEKIDKNNSWTSKAMMRLFVWKVFILHFFELFFLDTPLRVNLYGLVVLDRNYITIVAMLVYIIMYASFHVYNLYTLCIK